MYEMMQQVTGLREHTWRRRRRIIRAERGHQRRVGLKNGDEVCERIRADDDVRVNEAKQRSTSRRGPNIACLGGARARRRGVEYVRVPPTGNLSRAVARPVVYDDAFPVDANTLPDRAQATAKCCRSVVDRHDN